MTNLLPLSKINYRLLLQRRHPAIPHFSAFLIVCPLVFLAGFVDSIAGGGGLISLPAYLLAGLPIHNAIATNKLSSTTGTLVSTLRLVRNHFADLKLALPCMAASFCGSILGARIALLTSDAILKIVLLILLPIVAFYVLKKKDLEPDLTTQPSHLTQLTILISSSLLIGIYDGFYGPGTGTFLMLLLTAVAHVSLNEAAGITKVINLSTNVAALAVFLTHGVVWMPLAVAAAAFSIVGNYLGARYFVSKGTGFVKPVIIVVLTLFFLKLCYELFWS